MAVEIPLEVTADTDPVKAMVSELETLKNTLKADKRAIEDLKASIADMQIKKIDTATVDAAKLKLKDLEKAYVSLNRTAEDKSSALSALKDQVKAEADAASKTDKIQNESAKNSSERLKGFLGLGQALGGKIGEFSGKGQQLFEVFSKVSQGAEGSSGAIGKLGEALGKNGGKAAIAIAVIMALVLAIKAAITAIIDFTKHAITASDAARTMAITAVATFKGKSGAREWAQEVDYLRTKTDLSRQKLEEMGLSLKKFKGDEFTSAFRAIAVATSAIGDEGGKQIETLVNKIKDGTLKADDFKESAISIEEMAEALAKVKGTTAAQALKEIKANTVGVSEALLAVRVATDTAFGDAAEAKGKSVESLTAKLKENWDKLFSGADLKVFTHALERIVTLFDETGSSGSTLKDIIGKVSQFFIDIAAGALITFVDVMEEILIIGYSLYNVWLDIQLAILDAQDALDGMLDFGIDLASAGSSAVDGLIAGIKAKIPDAITAIKELGTSVKDAFKAILDIHSPSGVFEDLGINVAEGAAQGIEGGTPEVQAAAENMLPVPNDIENVSNNNTSAPTTISPVFNITGGDAMEIADQIRIVMTELLQNSLISRGVDPEEAAA